MLPCSQTPSRQLLSFSTPSQCCARTHTHAYARIHTRTHSLSCPALHTQDTAHTGHSRKSTCMRTAGPKYFSEFHLHRDAFPSTCVCMRACARRIQHAISSLQHAVSSHLPCSMGQKGRGGRREARKRRRGAEGGGGRREPVGRARGGTARAENTLSYSVLRQSTRIECSVVLGQGSKQLPIWYGYMVCLLARCASTQPRLFPPALPSCSYPAPLPYLGRSTRKNSSPGLPRAETSYMPSRRARSDLFMKFSLTVPSGSTTCATNLGYAHAHPRPHPHPHTLALG